MTFKEYCIENNLSTFLDEWADKNGALTPAMVLTTSRAKVWWQCACGHQWVQSVAKRIAGEGCAMCGTQHTKHLKLQPFSDEAEKSGKPLRVNLTGRTFGRLQVIEHAGVQKESMWRCRCTCGREVVLLHSKLTSGNTTSCGCKQDEVRKENFKNNIHFVEGTCIEKIAAKTTPKNNTSGFRGVSQRPNGRYRAGLTFKGKRYDLGTYPTLEKAIEARLAGEIMMDEFVENFKKQKGIYVV